MKIDSIRQKIQTISSESGIHFLALSTIFPQLIEEINLQSSTGLDSGSKLSEFKRVQKELEESIEKQEILLEDNSQFMNIFRKKNKELFQTFSDGVSLLENMNAEILKIKDESQEMEVISLNAMIISIKSGKQGQAFSYITSNLKRLSYQLITQAERLIAIDMQVQKDIRGLKKLTDVANIDDDEQSNEQSKISEALLTAFHTVEHKIAGMIEMVDTVKKPLLDAMEGIQMQDIIRQSLDDVDLAITRIRDASAIVDPNEQLDRINANIQLVDVAKNCLITITTKLKNSTDVFSTNSKRISGILENVNTMRSQLFIKQLSNGISCSSSDIETLQTCIQQSIQDFNKSMNIVQSNQDAQGDILEHSKKIQLEVQKIQGCFDEFAPIISNLMYVAVAQRIEIARTEAIGSIRDTVEYMANLVNQTSKNVEQAQSELEEFRNLSSSQILHFTDEIQKNKIWFSKIMEEKNSFTNGMEHLEDDMISVMKQFTVYSDTFIAQYAETGERIEDLKNLVKLLDSLQVDLATMNSEFEQEKKYLLQRHQLEDRSVQNNDILDFLKHFTITADKQEVANIVGVEVEQGVDAGEITFF